MSKICRTCLQRTNRTFSTSQELGSFGEGSVRISVVLRFCIPELYLGLSSNPQICFSCKENLKVAYLFKKKCLDTENTIGNYLKDVRCTGKSVDLHDVLAYISDETNSPVLLQEPNNTISIQNAANKLNDQVECEIVHSEDPQVVNTQKSAPNLTSQGNIMNISDYRNLAVNQIKLLNVVQTRSENNPDAPQAITDVQAQFVLSENSETGLQDKDESNSLCKISEVFSLNTDPEGIVENNKSNSTNFNNDADMETNVEDTLDIKDEPIDIDQNDNFNYTASDEETLDASETASFRNDCNSSLQDFIDNIPEINHPDQYVDVPDFVTINNFGFKELEEFKLQQVAKEANSTNASEATPNSINSDKPDILGDGAKLQMQVVKVLASAPDVIILNGKRMVKYGNQYKLEEEAPATGESLKEKITQGVQTKSVLASNRKRNRRKIKIVPVGEQPAEKRMKTEEQKQKLPKPEDKDVVVLFTNYTSEGDYVNDHDYLISPYKRNKVLISEDSQWMCMCFICNFRHQLHNHVKHMKTHGTWCMVCSMDLGTPYMLNIHCKIHRRPCRYCTEVLPFGSLKAHEENHIAEENKLIEKAKRKVYSVKRYRQKPKQEEKPVQIQLPKQEGNSLEKSDGSQSDGSLRTVAPEVQKESVINESEDSDNTKKRRPRRKQDAECVSDDVEKPRTLRTRVKRWYVESDEEGEVNKPVPVDSKGTVSDSKEDEK